MSTEIVDVVVPDYCEQMGCWQPVTTYCPLCEKMLCAEHDELVPRRMHDCLRGKADD